MKKILLAGNPNSGKTCIFNNLTGASAQVANYPGVTVEFEKGKSDFSGEEMNVIDLPGIYSLTAYSQEEIISRDIILKDNTDAIINVVDASNLERNLFLTIQLLELNVPLVIALNMSDIAEKKGLRIDHFKIIELLGVKVVPTSASKRQGMEKLKAAVVETIRNHNIAKPLQFPVELDESVQKIKKLLAYENLSGFGQASLFWLAMKLLEDDKDILSKIEKLEGCEKITAGLAEVKKDILTKTHEDSSTFVTEARYAIANGIMRASTGISEEGKVMLTEKIDAVACNRFMGPLIMLAVIYALFTCVFKFADEMSWLPLFNGEWASPMGLFEKFFQYLSGFTENYVANAALTSLINDGIIGGVGAVMSFVPLIFFMFFFVGILEDSGYIARVAFIMDRVFRAFGLQGKSIIAMIVSGGLGGGGCAVPGIMATRTLREEKDRLVTILVAPLMNCGAKMPVYAMLIAAFFASYKGAMLFLLWALSWFFALTAAFCLRKWVIKGEQTPFIMELPLYHMPMLRSLWRQAASRTWMYMKKAGTVILFVNIIIWAMMYFPRIDAEPGGKAKAEAIKTFSSVIPESKYQGLLSEEKIKDTISFADRYKALSEKSETSEAKEELAKLEKGEPLIFEFAKLYVQSTKEDKTDAVNSNGKLLSAFRDYKDTIVKIDEEEAQRRLTNSFAGKTGAFFEPLSRLAGFDWKDNIALIGGFAAKEVVVGTLGIAYSMGNVNPEESGSLSEQLAKDETWNKLKAFTLMLFVMIYAPCFATVVTIRKETNSWKWAFFSTAYSTVAAIVLAITVYQIGNIIF